MGASPVTIDALAERVRPVMLARDRQLPVLPALESLFPGGALRRGSVVTVDSGPGAGAGASGAGASSAGASGMTSLALALAAGPSRAGSWVAAVGLGSLGLLAADDLGVALDRLVLAAAAPAGVAPAAIVAALVDGFDVVLVAAGPGVRRRAADARRLVARVRERGSVLVAVGGDLPGQPGNVRLTVTDARWEGLGEEERGYLRRRRVSVAASGRGEASRPRRADLWLPTEEGKAVLASEVVALTPTRPDHPAAAPSRLGGEAAESLHQGARMQVAG